MALLSRLSTIKGTYASRKSLFSLFILVFMRLQEWDTHNIVAGAVQYSIVVNYGNSCVLLSVPLRLPAGGCSQTNPKRRVADSETYIFADATIPQSKDLRF